MSTPVEFREVRWRRKDSDQDWFLERIAGHAPGYSFKGVQRGVTYEIETRHIDIYRNPSEWTHDEITIPVANQGAAALPPVAIGNVSSRWQGSTEVTYSATDSSATISVSAGVLQVGDTEIAYGPSSATIPGTANEIKTIYLYYDDPRLQGGTRTLGFTTSSVGSMADYGRVLIAPITLTFPAAGGTSSGGGSIGGKGGGSGLSEGTTIEP